MNVATDRRTEPEQVSQGLTWRRLVFLAGVLATVAMGVVALLIGDIEGEVVVAGFAVATWLTRVRRGTLGAIGMALVSTIILYFMLTAAVTNLVLIGLVVWGASTARAETEAGDIHLVVKNVAFTEIEITTTAGEVRTRVTRSNSFDCVFLS